MLCELGLPYETREIITRSESMHDEGFVALTQRGKVPFLEDGDVAIGESAAMVQHLADRYRDRVVLAPERGSTPRARFDELCFFIMVELDALLYVLRRHEGLPDIYGHSPEACEAARGYFQRQARDIERCLEDGRPHLLGDGFSGADILLVSCLDWAQFAKVPVSEGLRSYRDRVAERPAFATAMKANFPPAAVASLQPG
jgi:glutathione S-transferase